MYVRAFNKGNDKKGEHAGSPLQYDQTFFSLPLLRLFGTQNKQFE